ncbi:MAG: FAD-dependent oxidoreductase [Candidatus Eisenbacteria bacterium]|uniref:FAD-dependent oxidoreductase n=1 Tax=Eiseniibacteriota bacterium TaxID=2212470 RepID=A0A9D6LAD9_UNCEI|nr:FAD-dependent oxidoreductase [Candidatus Eisenbacteria bacterium]
MRHPYVIVGGGHAGAAAIEGIRAHDASGGILMFSRENHPPYDRPALSKGLWFGKTTKDQLPIHDEAFYRERGVQLELRREVVEIDTVNRRIWDDRGATHDYEKLLLATGGRPRRLDVEGADSENVRYYRSLEDYLYFETMASRVQHVLVIGSGFIGMEMAAALRHAGLEVTLLFPDEYPLRRVLPRELGLYVADYYRDRGIETVSGEAVARFEDRGGEVIAFTHSGNEVRTQLVLAGIGIEPSTELAEAAGLETGDGIEVDEYARTSDAHVYAAGDAAEFPYLVLEKRTRIEHWDHAVQHGTAAGANMAGANRPYTTLPMFFSDLFDLGWEAVGEVDGSLVTHAVWREPMREGVVLYLRDDVIRGALLWNVWNKVDWARGLIREARVMNGAERERLVTDAMEQPA